MRPVLFTPVPAELAWSSLGFSAAWSGFGRCHTAVLSSGPLRASEDNTPLSNFDVIFASLAWELEVPTMAKALLDSGIEPDRVLRPENQPLIVAGGPLTRSNPDLLAACADAVFVGDADRAFDKIYSALAGAEGRLDALRRLALIPGCWVPAVHGIEFEVPIVVHRPKKTDLPICSPWPVRANNFGDAFLVEVGRGCPRLCAFCVATGEGAPARFATKEKILEVIPKQARRVGLLGAAVSDHPQLVAIVRELLARDIQVTLGSIRADRARSELVSLLASSGLKTLTVAADGTSQHIRDLIRKNISANDLLNAAMAARGAGIHRLRLYVMTGLPDEGDGDIDEFCELCEEISSVVRVSISISPFVPKRFTALADAPFLPVNEQKRRISRIKRSIGKRVQIRATSPREAEYEYWLSHVRGEEARKALTRP